MMKKILLSALLFSFIMPAIGAKAPQDGRIDPRIRNIVYNPNDVFVIHGHYRYSTHIVFAEDEVIEHVSPGDSIAWQFYLKKNHLFLQPVEDQADTNLSVLTNKRMYNFELKAGEAQSSSDTSLSFVVQFRYPEEELKKKMAGNTQSKKKARSRVQSGLNPETLNFSYSMRGNTQIAPNKVFDDGKFTYFQFENNVKTPAIFMVDADKKESLVNYHVKGPYIVVQSTGSQFMLRQGKQATCIYNDDAPTPKTLNQDLASSQ